MAALCAVIACSTLAFLWFNIPPARFYMGETGMMALTVTLEAIAVMTDSVLILPIAAFPFTYIFVCHPQKASRALRGRRFKLHHFTTTLKLSAGQNTKLQCDTGSSLCRFVLLSALYISFIN